MVRVIFTDISGVEEADYQALYERASSQRRYRADRYRNKPDAVRCLTAEALLRFALGTSDFTEEKTLDGKPYIPERQDFHYNLSHSGRWVVLAYGDSELGVDVEKIRMNTDIEAIAGRFFSAEERQYIREIPALSRSRFFEVWTAKESHIKYLGTGLKTDLTSFSVFSLSPALRIHYRKVDEDFCLSLCTKEDAYTVQRLNVRQLLYWNRNLE